MKLGIIRHMRFCVMLAILPLVAFGKTVTLESFPPSEFVDTEVSTNICIRVNLERLNRMRFVR